ncbi:beta and beta-prime subunits of DNA dependent RNA-polymerase [Aulographum hederae CBS 113979]|uniref:DNA-directed RNA polymerase subunit beta n=1 Tax=Aulographum hederae CBS 113979 TaxID=1176131 RepID=A0A6G1GX93_9PEZI|nr:beta and beta-prime subunits of DNA dependent RNA-polymerase [Aulographum hederae CBS 113979]
MAPAATSTEWPHGFHSKRRQHLFSNPPKDHTAYPALQAALEPHINSFNALFEKNGLLEEGIKDIGIKTFLDGDLTSSVGGHRNKVSVRIGNVFLDKSTLPATNKIATKSRAILPSECRERHATYRGKMRVRLEYRVNEEEWKESIREFGSLPIMLKSNRCHLENMSPSQLVQAKEETEELGGYFIVNGNEKLIRMLIVPRRNFPLAIIRPSFTNRGPTYTKYATQIRSCRPDQTSQTNVLHYLSDGNVIFRFSWRKSEFLIPVLMILRALVDTSDKEIFENLVGSAGSQGIEEKQFVMDRVELLLRSYKSYNLHTKSKNRSYIGEKFRISLGMSDDVTNEQAGTEFLRKIVLPHLGCYNVTTSQDHDKFKMIIYMIRKLYSLVEGECAADNPDAVSNQEILLPGFLYGMSLKERMEDWLNSLGILLTEWSRKNSFPAFTSEQFNKDFLPKVIRRSNEDLGQMLHYFLSTGNLVSSSGLDLQQTSGFTVMAEKINFYRFISHFRMVHRGAFFAQLRTTQVRKLLPESWGFLCPVHTPDGSPCGLLNHLSHECKVLTRKSDATRIPTLVAQLGVVGVQAPLLRDSIVVQLDGRVLGFCTPEQASTIHDSLRYWKVEGTHGVPKELEIGYVPVSNGGQYPGIYMYSQAARMIRPVKYLALDKEDYVGALEQPFMSIACTAPEIVPGEHTHVEYDPTNILSIVANQTPFSDFNQSPRNMYQCQMGKQTMGTPGVVLKYRSDNKLYRIQSGQTPIVRPPLHNTYGLDNFPQGTNVVVAVISYTGYDMDDAMIINKSAHERGFGYGSIYKQKHIDLGEKSRTKVPQKLFGFAPEGLVKAEWRVHLDDDGLPHVGTHLRDGDRICAYHTVSLDSTTNKLVNRDGRTHFETYHDPEDAFVEEVRLIGTELSDRPCQSISIKLRIARSPVIGDKFSSRHGQKGVCSQKWPTVDMPFTESGIQPDTIINPHAFPSRMTIGMFVESLAGKSGALHGLAQDSTPFRFDEKDTAVNYFGHQLKKAGYNFYGNEPMYSGITGQELSADIYIGVVYYQRLRHMVNDKYQVRTTGPNNRQTGQPIKGRKKGGGIRVGEMERDALLAHGTAFLLQDRLMNCSDYCKAWVCKSCGSFLSTQPIMGGYGAKGRAMGPVRCRRCAKRMEGWESKAMVWEDGEGGRWTGGEQVALVAIPGVLRFLDVELAAMGIRMKFKVDQ